MKTATKLTSVISYGEQIALTILIAKDLGLKASFIDSAERVIRGKTIQPCFIGYFEKEACRLIDEINRLGLKDKALNLIKKYYPDTQVN